MTKSEKRPRIAKTIRQPKARRERQRLGTPLKMLICSQPADWVCARWSYFLWVFRLLDLRISMQRDSSTLWVVLEVWRTIAKAIEWNEAETKFFLLVGCSGDNLYNCVSVCKQPSFQLYLYVKKEQVTRVEVIIVPLDAFKMKDAIVNCLLRWCWGC